MDLPRQKLYSVFMDQPLISIIIPFYNRPDLVKKSIQSIFDQTYKNWELIVVDDGSSVPFDTTILKKKKHASVIYHNNNKGAAAARNTGMRKAKGDYIAFLDSDDMWLPKKLEKQAALLNKNPKLGGCIVGYQYIGPEGQVGEKAITLNNVYEQSLYGEHLSLGSGFLFRRNCLKKVGDQSEDLKRLEDWEWQIKFAKHYEIKSIPETLVKIYAGAPPSFQNVKESIDQIRKRLSSTLTKEDRYRFETRCVYELIIAACQNKKYASLLFYAFKLLFKNPCYLHRKIKEKYFQRGQKK